MNEIQTVPKMLTIKQLSKQTGISQYAIRLMCKNNEIAFIRTGVKYLINADRFIDYLNGRQS